MIIHQEIRELKGILASPGIATGEAYVRRQDSEMILPRTLIPPENINKELEELKKAQELVGEELEILRKKIVAYLGNAYGDIISAQLAILRDKEIFREVRAYMEEHHVNVAFAYRLVVNQYIDILEDQSSEYFKERVADIRDVKRRVLRALIYKRTIVTALDTKDPVIFVAKELNPTDIMMLVSENVRGFITEFGGRTSHVAIMARTLKVPMLIGVRDVTERIETGQDLILDADHGKVLINPADELKKHYDEEIRLLEEKDRQFHEERKQKAISKDGFRMCLSANISLPIETKDILKYGAEGVGLYRTEYLYLMKHQLPGEEELFDEYRYVIDSLNGLPVTMRTIDLGGDKLSVLSSEDVRCESNPFMGYRAIRICLDNPPVFHTQLRAILRSSAYGKVSIMLPMLTHVEQLNESLKHIDKVKKDLQDEKIPFDADIKVGVMIETPSAVMNIQSFAKKADFFSIGTNDLTQYTLAVDRGNERVVNIYDHYDPAVIRMISNTVDAAKKHGIPVYICGEMASERRALLLFLGMKVDGISVATRYVGAVREFIRSCRQKDAEKILAKVLNMDNRREIGACLDRELQQLQSEK
jgi:phosphoenolpyruvate-protein phosphotransferase (PTS system enzyme I)